MSGAGEGFVLCLETGSLKLLLTAGIEITELKTTRCHRRIAPCEKIKRLLRDTLPNAIWDLIKATVGVGIASACTDTTLTFRAICR